MKLKKGYISEGKVKLGLVICAEAGYHCIKCPYYSFVNCRRVLSQEALTYITRLEIKVNDYEEQENKS